MERNKISRKSMTKLMLVTMELIILVILKVNANDSTTPSFAPTTLLTVLHLFQFDNANVSYIDHYIESTLKKCKLHEQFATAYILLKCLFQSPMHPKDFPINIGDMIVDCYEHCFVKLKLQGKRHALCPVHCYEEETKKHNIKN
jgi:hypothetical protein